MTLRVCIPTAGTGSRLAQETRFLNKSLVGIANRPALCHLIEQCPADAEFVIALGHKGHLVRQFLELAYPQRQFFFAEVDPFEGPGSGLGLSLLACRDYLQQPFVFMSCDTLVREALPPLSENWMACAERPDLSPYRTVRVENGRVTDLCEKGIGRAPTHAAYIGLAGIVDVGAFWAAMDAGGSATIGTGEAQGLRALLGSGVAAHRFTWFDTGHPDALEQARLAYAEAGAPNILPKANEAIWFVGDQVIKFSDDQQFIARRVQRAGALAGFVPAVDGARSNMYRYPKVGGEVMSEVADVPLFERLLRHCAGFWRPADLDPQAQAAFRAQCMKFYKDKTLERVALYYDNFKTSDNTAPINGAPMPLLATLLAEVDWDALADGLAGRFHGDFHFENILWSEREQAFTFLDWRQDFGGSLTVGDVYYDLAKLLHGLIISHPLIARDHYRADLAPQAVRIDFHRTQLLVDCERHFKAWLVRQGYSVHKVVTLTALIYLNIAALHHAPYCHLLYALGKSMLAETLDKEDSWQHGTT